MVTPVYPYYPNIHRHKASGDQQSAQQKHAGANQHPHTTQQPDKTATYTDNPQQTATASSASGATNQSTQKSQLGEVITLSDILADVGNTMDALGVNEDTRQTVHLYLKAVEHQASIKKPAKPFIHEGLKAIGRQLDEYIGVALKQPSRVVMDWVEALLIQPIDYRLTGKPTSTTTNTAQPAKPTSPQQASAKTSQPLSSNQASISEVIQYAKQMADQGDINGSIEHLNNALKHTKNDKDAVTLAYWQGRVFEKANALDEAVTIYKNIMATNELAPPYRYRAASLVAQQAEVTGDNTTAINAYTSAITAGNALYPKASPPKQGKLAKELANLENDFASLLFAQHPEQSETIQQHLSQARQWAITGDKRLLPDIYSNMATVFGASKQLENQQKAYLKGMNAAKKLGDQSAYLNLMARYQAVTA